MTLYSSFTLPAMFQPTFLCRNKAQLCDRTDSKGNVFVQGSSLTQYSQHKICVDLMLISGSEELLSESIQLLLLLPCKVAVPDFECCSFLKAGTNLAYLSMKNQLTRISLWANVFHLHPPHQIRFAPESTSSS